VKDNDLEQIRTALGKNMKQDLEKKAKLIESL
jgi:hypothetical protein